MTDRVTSPAEALQALRAAGWTPGHMATVIGVNERTVRRWLSGTSRPRSEAHIRAVLRAARGLRAATTGSGAETPNEAR